MSKAASRGSKVELVATTMASGGDSSPGPLTRSARKNAGAARAAAASKPSSSSRFGAEAVAGGSGASTATVAAAAKKETTTSTRARGGAQKASRSSPSPSSPKYSVLLPTYCEAQNIGIIVSMLVKVFEEK